MSTYCLIEIRSGTEISRRPMSEECYRTVMEGLEATKLLRTVQEKFYCFHEALQELQDWCIQAPRDAEFLTRNLHTAERLCRGVLYEYKTFLDHTAKLLKNTFGKDSEAANAFIQGTHDAYDQNPEYAFVYQLRNSMQHFDGIVHSFEAPNKRPYLQPCANPQILLRDNGWKEQEKNYILAVSGNIDLHAAFVATYNAMEHIMVPVMNYLLGWNDGGANIVMLKNWIEPLFSREDSKYFHLAEVGEAGNVTAITVFWEVIYKIADSLKS